MANPIRGQEETFPTSPAQRRLWLLDALEQSNACHHRVVARRLTGAVDTEALDKALAEVVRRQAMLRARFTAEEGEPVMRISTAGGVRLSVEDLRSLPPAEREATLLRRAREEGQRPFELANGPLLRALLFRLEDEVHVLQLISHQLIADTASMTVLLRELSAFYDRAMARGSQTVSAEDYLAGRASYGSMRLEATGLPELPQTYAAFSSAQRQWLGGAEAAAQVDYWKKQLAGAPPWELPLDGPRPPVRALKGARHDFELPGLLAEKVRAFARGEGTSPQAVLLAGFEAALHDWSGMEELTIGVRFDGRGRTELKGLIGAFSNELVLRTHVSGKRSFRELLHQVSEVARAGQAHSDVPFATLIEELRPERDMSRPPLLQVLFALEEAPTGPDLPGVRAEPFEVDLGTSEFDLALHVVDGSGALRAFIEYDTALFEAPTIARLATSLCTLLEGALEAPERPRRVTEAPVLTEEQRQRVLVEWNATAVEFPSTRCVHHLIEAQVERTPEAEAVSFEGTALTYRELDRRANQLAHHLLRQGVGPEVRVALCVERSLELVIGMLGILKAGGAYVPLDPAYPRDRLGYMLRDSGAHVLVTQSHVDAPLPPDSSVTRLDVDTLAASAEHTGNPSAGASAGNLAYVIYTSGSTGQPKGVQVPHRTVANFFTAMDACVQVPARGVWLAVTSISFDISVLELLWTLSRGFTVVVQSNTLGTAWLPEAVRRHSITHFQCTPSLARALLLDASSAEALRSLQQMLVGGEAMSLELARELRQRVPSLLNMYGPTETTVWSSTCSVPARLDGSVPLGTPLANTRLYVLDEDMQPVPPGSSGELFIGGEGVVRGYLGRPELTAERFVPDPFHTSPGARLYRTGDRVRRREDGTLEFLGRIDFQVKVRGFRIEPGEVEAVLARHPQVQQAVVMAREDTPGDKRLVAYVVPRPKQSPSWGALREFLGQSLPEYMVPSACVLLEALPLTPSGKVERRQLPAPARERPELAAARVPPRTPVEEALVQVWAEVLGLSQDRVGIQDNFFYLGGDSLKAIWVVSRAARAGLRLTASQVIQHPTIERLATLAGTRQERAPEQEAAEGEVLLNPIQRWTLEQGLEEPHHNNVAMMLTAPADLDAALLERACRAVIAHHEALRFCFPRTPEGGWRQVCKPTVDDSFWSIIDLSAVPEEGLAMALMGETNRLNAGLDLARGPLVRMTLFRLGAQGCRFHLVFHHLVMDPLSLSVVVEDIQTAYEQLRRGEAVQLPPRTMSLQRWSESLRDLARSEEMRQQRSYWREVVHAPFHPLPMDFPTGDARNYAARFATGGLSAEETRALLEDLPRTHGINIDEAMLTALVLALETLTHRRTLHVSVAGHGRDVDVPGADVSRTVGYFTTLSPRYLDAEGTPDALGALRAIQAQLRAVPTKGFGWGVLRYMSEDEQVRRELASAPVPEVTYNYMGAMDQGLPGVTLFSPAREFQGMEYAPNDRRIERVVLLAMTLGGQMQFMLLYCEAIYRKETMDGIAATLHSVLRTFAALARPGQG